MLAESNPYLGTGTKKKWIVQVISYGIIPTALFSVRMYSEETRHHYTFFWWGIIAFILVAYGLAVKHLADNSSKKMMVPVWIYLYWNILHIVRGGFEAENYWDWRGLTYNTLGLLLPMTALAVSNIQILGAIMRTYVWYALPLFLPCALLISTDAYGLYLVPISLLLLFSPVLDKKWKILTFIISMFVIVVDLGARSNVIRSLIPLLFTLIYHLRRFIHPQLLSIARVSFLFAPFVLFTLGVSGIFNIFRIDEYFKSDYVATRIIDNGEVFEDPLTADTRTFLYEDVLRTAERRDTWWLGRSPARGNDTDFFDSAFELTGRYERLANEVGILNVFTWTGIIGVALYFWVFLHASHLAVYHSKNIFSKMIGVFVAFRWLYSWIEDINDYSINYMFVWFFIGLAYSEPFRNMSNKQVANWINNALKRPKNWKKRKPFEQAPHLILQR